MFRSIAVLVIAVAVGLAGGACGDNGGGSGSDSAGDRGGSGDYVDKKACELLTLDDAKSLIGPDARKAEGPGVADLERRDISLTNCSYHDEKVEHFVGVMLRAAHTETGARENERIFDEARPSATTDVSGIGEKAVWDIKLGQLVVYAKGSFLIFNNDKGKALSKPETSLEEAKKVADIVLPRL